MSQPSQHLHFKDKMTRDAPSTPKKKLALLLNFLVKVYFLQQFTTKESKTETGCILLCPIYKIFSNLVRIKVILRKVNYKTTV